MTGPATMAFARGADAIPTRSNALLRFSTRTPCLLMLLVVGVGIASGVHASEPLGAPLLQRVTADHRQFYSGGSLLALAAGVAVSGIMAHTTVDTGVRDLYQDRLRSPFTDGVSNPFSLAGDVRVAAPLMLSGALVGEVWPQSPTAAACGRWGQHALRALLVGTPPVLLLENLLGSPEPEDAGDSEWAPFEDNAGVSGHAFLGAVTFLSAARTARGPAARGMLFAASALPGLSRINDDEHYLSQVVLGWLIGYLAVDAVEAPAWGPAPLSLSPGLVGRHPGVILTRAF